MPREKEIGSFKVGDAVKKPVSPTSASQAAAGRKKGSQKEEEAPSAGFAQIEKLIEADTLEVSALRERHAALEELTKKGDMKTKAGARKATLAYGHVLDLIDYLWSTKQALQGGGPADKAPEKGGKSAPAAKGKKR